MKKDQLQFFVIRDIVNSFYSVCFQKNVHQFLVYCMFELAPDLVVGRLLARGLTDQYIDADGRYKGYANILLSL